MLLSTIYLKVINVFNCGKVEFSLVDDKIIDRGRTELKK